MTQTFYAAEGFTAAATHAGLKPDSTLDMALILSDRPCTAAGVFTRNRVKAAPVVYDQALLARPDAQPRAVVINTGSANACTGDQGLANTRRTAEQVAAATGCTPQDVLVLSTGVIGMHLPMDAIEAGVTDLSRNPQAGEDAWRAAAAAIMTTDTRPKVASVRHPDGYTITGIAKGAGMIAPNMATMLAVLVTDAAVSGDVLTTALTQATEASFNRIVVDGDMSTNDTVLALANGASGTTVTNAIAFTQALTEVCTVLAQAIVRDGEGATKFVTVQVSGAPDEASARAIANTIATSALVKTAFYGADPNWGRIVAAAGRAGIEVDPDRMALWLLDVGGDPVLQLLDGGCPLDYDEPAAIRHMQGPEWGFRLDLGLGDATDWIWTCDLSHDYVTINGHYRT